MRRTALALVRGETAYLVPKTLGCGRDCWTRPKVTIVNTANRPMLIVRLPDGRDIEVHEKNVVRELPEPAPHRPAAPRPRTAHPNVEEVPLW